MAQEWYSDEDVLKLLREIDVHMRNGLDVVGACRKAEISDKTCFNWRMKFGGRDRGQFSEMWRFKKNGRHERIVAGPQFDELIQKERLDY